MNKKTNMKMVIVLAGVALIVFLSMITHSYYQNVLKQIEVAGMEESRSYKYHYVLIVDDCEMQFWKDVYESMKAEAEKQDALVELMGRSLSSDMEIENFMDMSIAAKVDGIVLEYTGDHRLSDRIEEASRAGIPVVTVLKDAPATSRESYVGINSYQLGQQYGELVMELARKNRDGAEVMVLTHDSGNDGSQSQILEQINNFVVTSPDVGGRIHVTRENIQSTGKVDADEALRNIFFRQEGAPDILICMDSVDTEAAYQAMIDYNKVGEIQLVGYYQSPTILNAVEKGNIPATLVLNTEQMGLDCVRALTDYRREGRVNSYYSVDFSFVTSENVQEFMKSE